MKFQNKIKAFLLTLLCDHKFNKVIKYFLLFGGKKLTLKQEFITVFMVTSTDCCLSFKNAMNSYKQCTQII